MVREMAAIPYRPYPWPRKCLACDGFGFVVLPLECSPWVFGPRGTLSPTADCRPCKRTGVISSETEWRKHWPERI